MPVNVSELDRRLAFLKEIDQLKSVIRRSPLIDRSRRENSAEHSWHLAMYAIVLADYANGPVDVLRVIKMLLIHDIVEIDAGDMPLHEATDPVGQAQRERAAAERIFGLLPAGLTGELGALWFEFEAGETDDAKFAKALDRFQPVLHNAATGGGTWIESSVSLEQVKSRCGPPIERGASGLWAAALELVESHYRAENDRSR